MGLGSRPLGGALPPAAEAGGGAEANAELEAAAAQSALLMDALLAGPGKGGADAFSALKEAGGWDGRPDLMLRGCVVDLTLDFCSRAATGIYRESPEDIPEEELMQKLSDAEPFCGVFEMCFENDFENETCRPDSCPFWNEMGCRYTAACLDGAVQKEYRLMMAGS
jgi:hypothetical protein